MPSANVLQPKKRVCIVGAGPSGLPAIRHALFYENVDVVCFEASAHVGGLWRYKPQETEESSVMKSTVINSSKELSAYSDFPPDEFMANFMHNQEMLRYFEMYAKNFDLRKYIKFNHKVLGITRSSDYQQNGQWTVEYTDETGTVHSEVFDGVLLCSGHHTIPHWPKPFAGQENYKGKIIHSHSYKDHRGYEDKVVVVVGVGNSGGDIAVELSRIAKQVYLVTRRGTWVFNRIYDYGEPLDLVLNRRAVHYSRQLVPIWVSAAVVESKLNQRFDHAKYGLKPENNCFGSHIMVNDELPNRIACGTVRIKPNIKQFSEYSVEFEDGSIVPNVDEVIYCTGFSFEFNLVEQGKLIPVEENEVSLYHNMYPLVTSDHNTLAVIGLIQPIGSIMPISEMQCRLFYENLFGERGNLLPSLSEMKETIEKKQEAMHNRYVKSRRHTIQVDYIEFMDELAKMIGCMPNFSQMITKDPGLALKAFFGPNVPYVYRLNGPNAWTGAPNAIKTLRYRVLKGINARNTGDSSCCTYTYVIAFAVLVFAILAIFWH